LLKGSKQENHAQIIRHGRNKTVGGKRGGVGGYARESFAYEFELEIHRKAMALDVRSTVRGAERAKPVRIYIYSSPFFLGAKATRSSSISIYVH
jgi:hypothetical protein